MATKNLKTRIQNKHDTEANWAKATTFKPLAGELIIYDKDSNNAKPRFKIGDGITTVTNLPFVAIDYGGRITSLESTVNGLGTAAQKDVGFFATAAQGTKADNAVPKTRKVNNKALSADITLGASDVGVTESAFPGLKKTGTITGIKMNGSSKGTSGVVDLGTVLTNASAFATSAQGTKADNAMPKSGGTFTGNISVPQTITFTDNTNPFIKMTTGGTDFYFQSTNGQFGLGPTWNKATHWDSNGNVTFPTVPKVGSTSLVLTSSFSLSGTTLTITV